MPYRMNYTHMNTRYKVELAPLYVQLVADQSGNQVVQVGATPPWHIFAADDSDIGLQSGGYSPGHFQYDDTNNRILSSSIGGRSEIRQNDPNHLILYSEFTTYIVNPRTNDQPKGEFMDYRDWNGQSQRVQLIPVQRFDIAEVYLGKQVTINLELRPLGPTPLLTASGYDKVNSNFTFLPIQL